MMEQVLARPWSRLAIAVSVAVLMASGCARVSPTTAERVSAEVRETADWVPFKGRIRLGHTWGHPEGHAFPAVDFQVPSGSSFRVYAAGSGTVFDSYGSCPDTTSSGEHAGCKGGNGNFVDIIHPDGRRSRYLHLRQGGVFVEPGQYVCRGCLIGHSGWSGNVSPLGPDGAHLHYEELIGYNLVPPGQMFAQGRFGPISHPSGARTWQDLGVQNPYIVNRGFPAPDPPPKGSCFGWVPTLVGTEGRDRLEGTPGHDVILARGGNDTIRGEEGEDRVCGGSGKDVVIAGLHPDHIDGGGGEDTCYQGESDGLENLAPGRVVSCEKPSYVLTVTSEGTLVSSDPPGISCPGDCAETFVTQTEVRLIATPVGILWAGCDTSTETSCTVTMSRDRTVRA